MTDGCKPIRILRTTFLLSLLLCGPVVYGVFLIGFHVSRSFTAGFVLAGLFMVTCLVSFIALAIWPCPQCHRRFVRFNAFWPRRCSHCGQGC